MVLSAKTADADVVASGDLAAVADFRFSDERAEIVKILNTGNVAGLPVLRTMMNRDREFNPQAFQVFSIAHPTHPDG